MKKPIHTIIFSILGWLVFNSSVYSFPKKIPDDFAIDYSFGGGRSIAYKKIHLQVGDCTFESKPGYDDEPLVYTFQLKREDLEPLYTQLNAIRAFTLKSTQQKVHDRGGESVVYTMNGKYYEVSNSGRNFIIGSHQPAFAKSTFLITSFADKYHP